MALREDEVVEVEEELLEEEEEEGWTLPVVGPWLMTEPRCTSAAGDTGGVMRGQLAWEKSIGTVERVGRENTLKSKKKVGAVNSVPWD